jgi:hypothetical protein
VTLSMTKAQHEAARGFLYPGDSKEAAALLLCGRRNGGERHRLLAYRLVEVPPHAYARRERDALTWKTGFLVPHLQEAARKGLALVKLHSHPNGFADFSRIDDEADLTLFPSIHGWVDDGLPHASAIMLPDGRLFGRAYAEDGTVCGFERVTVVGDDITTWSGTPNEGAVSEFGLRNAQTFGEATYRLLRSLSVAVVGCSGTGSVVVELLARLMVGRLILIDHDLVEAKNLNRILGATAADVGRPKVEVLRDHVQRMGLATHVEAHPVDLFDSRALMAAVGADVAFGCMDSVDGRHILNRAATFYLLPYFDLGVRLEANGKGGIDQVCGSVHYVQPGRSSLFTRGLYTEERLRAAHLRRTAPDDFEAERKEGYIAGVDEDRPAVAPVNALFSARGVLELLARLHPFRIDSNADFASLTESVSGGFVRTLPEAHADPALLSYVGRGDMVPILDSPLLSIRADS